MRILLFASPAFYNNFDGIGSPYNGGGWMYTIQKELNNRSNIELAIAFGDNSLNKLKKIKQNDFLYYVFPFHKKNKKQKIYDLINFRDKTIDKKYWNFYHANNKNIIEDFKPDIIHIFGSETYCQLITLSAHGIPTIVHIQGLLSLYIYSILPPGVSRWGFIWKDRSFKKAYQNFQELVNWNRSVYREKAILKSATYIFGRTHWDKQALSIINPNANYLYCGEILRPEFYDLKLRAIPQKLTIISITSAPLYKGFDLILKIANILKEDIGVEFDWKVYGNLDYRIAERISGIKHSDVNIKLCGVVNARLLCEELSNCTLYVQSSYVENSPNSLAEAQILGVPVVATNVGGTSSMVEHEVTGYLFPSSDPYMAAYYINHIYSNPELNIKVGNSAKEIAQKRHDKETIVNSVISAYNKILKK